jgi:hypothetical protein
MAGVKVTDLPVLGAAASDDVLYIVDTSSNTSSQIEVANLSGSLGLDFGTYTPVAISNSGAVLLISPTDGLYTVIGDIVTCTIRGTASLDFSGSNNGTAAVSLPIALSANTVIGTLTVNAQNQFTGYVDDNANLSFFSNDTSLVGLGIDFCAIFQYEKA